MKITPELRQKVRDMIPTMKDSPDCEIDEVLLLSKEISQYLISQTSGDKGREG